MTYDQEMQNFLDKLMILFNESGFSPFDCMYGVGTTVAAVTQFVNDNRDSMFNDYPIDTRQALIDKFIEGTKHQMIVIQRSN